MPMATFCCMEHAQNHANQSPPMTGHRMVAILNLNLLTSYICTIRCQQLTSTPFLIYGQRLYLKRAGVLCFPTTKRCTKQLTILNLGMLSGSPSLSNIMETQDLVLCLGCRVWFQDPRKVAHNMLANPDFAHEMDYQPFREYDSKTSTRRWQDFMLGDWSWCQAVSRSIFIYLGCLT